MIMSSTTRLFVGNLPNNTKEDDIRSAFSEYGELVNLDLKTKSDGDQDKKVFAFVTLSASNYQVESCIHDFSNKDFQGNKLYVTKARESFLERLQRERQESQNKTRPIGNKTTQECYPPKRKIKSPSNSPVREAVKVKNDKVQKKEKVHAQKNTTVSKTGINENTSSSVENNKKNDSDKKRLESLKRKRQDFKEKQNIIKSGLVGIDKVLNKKIRFDDDYTEPTPLNSDISKPKKAKKSTLFEDDDESSDEVNFNIKEQFEGKKGQKVLDLQSRYKSDKRFVLDERFIEDENPEENGKEGDNPTEEQIEQATGDEKSKQLSILQDVLGIAVTQRPNEQTTNKKNKARMGMPRFDPLQPDHARLLAPVDETKQEMKPSKKKKNKEKKEEPLSQQPATEPNKVEVSQEQFYQVSEKLKEVIEQPTTFSLRSLFTKDNEDTSKEIEQNAGYTPLNTKVSKKKNPLEPNAKNPFTYDSSESEAENDDEDQKEVQALPQNVAPQAVWKENFFFKDTDPRFTEALAFFNNTSDDREHKERRELKSLVKKRIYNKERKNQMFQKKIGGRKKIMKKSYRKK